LTKPGLGRLSRRSNESDGIVDVAVVPQDMCAMFSCHGIDGDSDKINQDCASVAYPLAADAHAALFIVLDGHGLHGTSVSNALLAELNDRIGRKGWGASDRRLTRQLIDAFEGAHRSLISGPASELHISGPTAQKTADMAAEVHGAITGADLVSGDLVGKRTVSILHGTESGACAVVVLLRLRRLITAHAGDCRAVLGTLDEAGSLHPHDLTRDHKLADEEAERVRKCGGWIRPMREEPFLEPARVYTRQDNQRAGPGLAMARSLGDLDADAIGVIPTPEVSFRSLVNGRDRFVILASDGLWELLSSQTVVEVVGGFLDRGEPAISAARFLIAMAALAWKTEEEDYRDDITAVVVYLDDACRQIEIESSCNTRSRAHKIESSCNTSRPASGSSQLRSSQLITSRPASGSSARNPSPAATRNHAAAKSKASGQRIDLG